MSDHYYDPKTGEARHFIEKKSGGGTRPSTIRDAKANNWVPGCTTILKVLDKPALRAWLIRQAVYAVTTAPDLPGENLDAKIVRVLEQEQQQDEESQIARDRGTELHDAIECWFSGREVAPDARPWIEPAAKAVAVYGKYVVAEKVLIGEGYGGKVDLILESPECWTLFDHKSTKRLPEKGCYPEHRLQLAAYAAAFYKLISDNLSPWYAPEHQKPIKVANYYISTVEQGKFVICEHEDWQKTYQAFRNLVDFWCWQNSYRPQQ